MQRVKPSIAESLLKLTSVLLAAVTLSACGNLAFYGQAISGQFEVLQKRQPIGAVLSDAAISDELRRKLELVVAVREFAVTELGLPDNDSYRFYADLERPFVLWNVFATPEFSLTSVDSCFLFFGCIAYRGYFSEAGAQRRADALRATGHDVYVGGVAAYSTIGWFDDPVLNTMLTSDDAWIIKVVFHELAHQRLYVRDDTSFNESFATMVAEQGLERWNRLHGRPGTGVRQARERDEAFVALVLKYRTRLEHVYSDTPSEAKKRELKEAAFTMLRGEYEQLKSTWQGYRGYDKWMSADLNNAKLASVAAYYDYVPAFDAILELTHSNIEQFYEIAKHVGRLNPDERDRCLRLLMADGPGSAPSCIAP